MAHLSLAFLGALRAELDGAPVTAFESDKGRALLAYLALEADRPHRRDALAGLLWPERPERAAHLSLNQALANLRHAIGDRTATVPVLRSTPETIQFDRASDSDLDVTTFSDLLAACDGHPHRHVETCTSCARRLHQAVDLYHGGLLDQFFLRDSAAFEEWALLKREQLHRRAITALAQLADYHERHGAYALAEPYTRRQLELDPWREASHRQLMRLLGASGQRSAALAQYTTCRRILVAELGVEPEEETAALYVRIQRGEALTDAQPVRAPTNLAAHTPPTPLIGRETELAQLADRLEQRDCRLLTLLGTGGIGKTRLALQAATDLRAAYRDGACFVALGPLHAAEFVVPAIAGALGFALHGLAEPKAQLLAYLHAKDMLLVLDNFEHLVTAAPLVSELLAACPDMTVLATSRAPLHVRGEQQFPVPPLQLPDLAQLPDVRRLTQYAAVALFVERAQAVQPAFHMTAATALVVATICARLDGLPLAIELAAARSKLFPPAALLARLEHRLALLTGGARDLPIRQQTIRATIDWSYNLLDAGEQRLFARLGVFVGGCTAEAAEAVGTADGDLPWDVVDGLAALLDKNLLQHVEEPDGAPRFTLLETIREFALERLAAGGEVATAQQRHAEYYLTLVERAEGAFHGPQARAWMDRLEADHDNLRAALAWSQSVGDAALGLRLAGALWMFWRARGYWSEGRDWLTGLLMLTQRSEPASSIMQAKAAHGAGVLANCQGDYARAGVLCKQSLALFSKLGDKRGMAWAVNELGYVAQEQSGHAQATVCFQESLTLFRELGDKQGIAESLDNLGRMARDQSDYAHATTLFQESLMLFRELQDKRGVALALKSAGNMAWLQGNYATARSVFEESLPLFRELGDSWGAALSLNHLGLVEREQGGYTAARSLHEESLALRRALGDKTGSAYSLHDLGIVVHRQGDNAQARTLLDESLDMFRGLRDTGGIALALNTLGHVTQSQGEASRAASLFLESLVLYQELEFKPGIAGTLAGLARVAGATEQPERAARLFGAAAALREAAGIPLAAVDRADYDRAIAAVRAQLDDATFAAAWAAGRALPLEQAIAEALQAAA